MNYQELVKLFSAPRLERYLEAVDGDEAKAVELYYQQSVLCGQFSALISYFEVLFRNQVNNHLVANYDPQWLVVLGEDGSAMDKLNTSHTFSALKEVRTRLNGNLRAKLQIALVFSLILLIVSIQYVVFNFLKGLNMKKSDVNYVGASYKNGANTEMARLDITVQSVD